MLCLETKTTATATTLEKEEGEVSPDRHFHIVSELSYRREGSRVVLC